MGEMEESIERRPPSCSIFLALTFVTSNINLGGISFLGFYSLALAVWHVIFTAMPESSFYVIGLNSLD